MKLRNSVFAVLITILLCSASFADISLRDAKRTLANGTPVTFNGLSVTAQFTGQVYVEQTDRAQGIRVDTSRTFAIGTIVNVSGTIQTDIATDERYIAAYSEYPQTPPGGGTYVVPPVMLINRSVTGGDSGLLKGISGDQNLNNIGMLVTVIGPISSFDDAFDPKVWFAVGAPNDQEVKVVVPSAVKLDKYWEYAKVTGICTAEKVGDQMIRVVKVRVQSDIAGSNPFVENILENMTLDEKVGQMFTIQVSGTTFSGTMQSNIQNYHLGGIIYLQANIADPSDAATLSNALQQCSINSSGIPLLISVDQEGGRVTRITTGSDFPGNMALGASRDPDQAYAAGTVFGTEVRAIGANMDLAPVLDVNCEPLNPVIGVRSFGEQPSLVSQMGIAYLDGLHASNTVATAKHFPGHGDTATDSHSGLPIITLLEYDFPSFDAMHAEPFRQCINNGLDVVMTAHIIVECLDPDFPSTLSPLVVNGYLRDELAFDGVCITDSLGMGALANYGTAGDIAVAAANAGVDILLSPTDLSLAFNAVKNNVSLARINESVIRILNLKRKYGLFENPYANPDVADDIVGSPEHWAVELDAARYGATLIKNASSVLPLNLTSSQKILLVTVQASETTTDAATRFNSYIVQKHPYSGKVDSRSITANPTSSQRTTIVNAAASCNVIIVGTSRAQISANVGQATLVNQLIGTGKPVIVVGLREPYEYSMFPTVNAYLAAYNYRNCGFAAAADILFGDWNPSGLLPVTVPGYYNFGWGLSY